MTLIAQLRSLVKGGMQERPGELHSFRILKLPENIDKELFIDALLGRQLMVYHDLQAGNTLLISHSESLFTMLAAAFPGLELSKAECLLPLDRRLLLMSFVVTKENASTFDDLYKMFSGASSFLAVSYMPVGRAYVKKVKAETEHKASTKETGFTRSEGSRSISHSQTSTVHQELYYDSDEKMILNSMLETLNGAMLVNGTAYKVVLVADSEDALLREYVRSKLLVVGERSARVGSLQELFTAVRHINAMPFDNAHAALTLGFSNSIPRSSLIASHGAISEGDLEFGNYLEGSVRESNQVVRTRRETLNLGTLISGVPGSGKTFAAMHMVGEALKGAKVATAIISPTEEWNSFGDKNRFHVLSFYSSRMPVNFFRCDSGINIEKFYENLAMLLAQALDAGPYTKPMEKCLLSAFRKAYAKTSTPAPLEVYGQIEEAIVERHGRKTHAGVRYTKHGENIKAALENMRQMLSRPEFAGEESIDFRQVMEDGVVFDLSKVSNKLKPFFYALILNQIYSFTDSFDIYGDDKLRLLLCLEEAQLVFGGEEMSAAATDLVQRIQDFRKRGVGLILVTHNVTDIEPSIRRLCQTKLYFRQSADVAKYAAADLLFGEAERDALVERLKSLGQRICALNYISETNGEKFLASSLFVKVPLLNLEESEGSSQVRSGRV